MKKRIEKEMQKYQHRYKLHQYLKYARQWCFALAYKMVRYARYMRRIAGKTQFIVITHRRGTMEAADVLYGVTMQEQGVSKILHMDLNQMEQELGIME